METKLEGSTTAHWQPDDEERLCNAKVALLQVQGQDILAVLDVEGFEELEIRLPPTCADTTAVQLAVSLSHLKVVWDAVSLSISPCALGNASPRAHHRNMTLRSQASKLSTQGLPPPP